MASHDIVEYEGWTNIKKMNNTSFIHGILIPTTYGTSDALTHRWLLQEYKIFSK